MNIDINNRNVLQGVLLLIAGFLLLLYTLNWITTGINLVLILIAIGFIIYGAVISGIDQYVVGAVKRVKQLFKK